MQRNAPVRLMSTTVRHCSTVRSSSGTPGAGDAGVVEQQVDPAERLDGPAEESRHRVRIGDVGGHGERPFASGPASRATFSSGSAPAPRQHHRPPVFHQRERHRTSDAAPRSRHNRNHGSYFIVPGAPLPRDWSPVASRPLGGSRRRPAAFRPFDTLRAVLSLPKDVLKPEATHSRKTQGGTTRKPELRGGHRGQQLKRPGRHDAP